MSEQPLEDLFALLSAPFEEQEIEWKPQHVTGNRALAVPYVDARTVMDRLDRALGLGGWQTSYDLVEGGVVCRLRVLVGGGWIEHQDVGSPSEQPDDGDRLKAAFSDALKRVAVHIGVSRYLYRLEPVWVGYDPQKKRLTETPRLPAWALPPRATKPGPAQQSAARVTAPPQEARPGRALPADGPELRKRLYDHDERLARQGLCKAGALVEHVLAAGVKAGYEPDLSAWAGPAILLAVEETKAFEQEARSKKCSGSAAHAIGQYFGTLGWDAGNRKAFLAEYGVEDEASLTRSQAHAATSRLSDLLRGAQVGDVPPGARPAGGLTPEEWGVLKAELARTGKTAGDLKSQLQLPTRKKSLAREDLSRAEYEAAVKWLAALPDAPKG